MIEGPKTPRETSEKASSEATSQALPRSNMHAKAREHSVKVVLNRENLKGTSLTGVKPSTQVVSAPAAPKHINVRAVPRLPVAKVEEVSSVERTRAVGNLPVPKAALTLPKSTPVCSIRAHPTPSPKDRIFPSSRVSLTILTPNAISTRRVASDVTRRKIETQLRVSNAPVSQVPLVSPSSQMMSTLRTTDVVNTRRGGKGTTRWNPETRTPSRVSRSTTLPLPGKSPISVRRLPSVVRQKPTVGLKVETRTRVSLKTATPRFGKIPSADSIIVLK